MHHSYVAGLFLSFVSIGHSTITFPSEGAKWPVGEASSITWETSELQGPISVFLGSGEGAATTRATLLASGVPNTGSLTWAPGEANVLESAVVIAVDSKKKSVHSKTFVIIGKNGNKHGGKEEEKMKERPAHPGATTLITETQTSVATHVVTSIVQKTGVKYIVTLTESHAPILSQPATHNNVTLSASTQDAIIATPSTEGTSSGFALPTGTIAAGNGSFVSPTATAGAPQQSFTGAAMPFLVARSNTLFAGGLVGLFVVGLW